MTIQRRKIIARAAAACAAATLQPFQAASAQQAWPSRILAALKAFVLELLGVGQQSRIYPGGPNRFTYLPHAFANGVEERSACILHQMPAVGDLNCVRERPLSRHRVAATA